MNTIKIIKEVIEHIVSSIILNDDFIRNPINSENNFVDDDNDDDEDDSIDNGEHKHYDYNNTICVHYEKNEEDDFDEYNEIYELKEQNQTIKDRLDNPDFIIYEAIINEIISNIEYKYNIYNNPVNNFKYHYVSNSLRLFLIEQGFIECNSHNFQQDHSQYASSINDNIDLFIPDFKYHLLLESELLQNKNYSGFFIITNNCCEFIVRTENNIIDVIQKLLIYLSYDRKNDCNLKNYKYIAKKTGQNVLKINNYLREKIYQKFGAILILNEFPLYLKESIMIDYDETSYKKMFVFLTGLETIIACNLSKDKLKFFEFIKKNQKSDVLKNYMSLLNIIFKYEWKERIYIKINIDNLIKSMNHESLIPDLFT